MHEYIDAHNHLQDVLLTHDLDKALTAVRSLPVRWMVVNGTTETDWAIVHRLAKDLPFVIPSYGLHPWYLRQRSQSWAKKLYDYLVESPAAVGETGLDRWIKDYDFESQQAILRKHLAFAAELDRPLTVHCLRAWEELLDLLGTSPRLARGFLLHSYGGPVELVDSFVELGAYFSFSGYFLNENKKAKLALFCDIPADRLLVETDAPAMPLPPDRIEFPLPQTEEGLCPNHPANIRAVYRGLAELRQLPEQELAAMVRRNFDRLFQTVIRDLGPRNTLA
jgi:TatD DNase family protein